MLRLLVASSTEPVGNVSSPSVELSESRTKSNVFSEAESAWKSICRSNASRSQRSPLRAIADGPRKVL